jgi:SAM-dependent methyltransferase
MLNHKNLLKTLEEKGLFDRKKLGKNYKFSNPEQVDFLLEAVDTNLKERIAFLKKTPQAVMNYGSHKKLTGQWLDSAPFYKEYEGPDFDVIDLDPESIDLFYSCLNLHKCNHLASFFEQIKLSLKPKGVFVGSLFGEYTLQELKDCFIKAEFDSSTKPHIHPFRSLDDIVSLLRQSGFDMPIVDRDQIIVQYETLPDLFDDLKSLGETNALKARFKGLTSLSLFAKVEEIYQKDYAHPDGTLPRTFDVIYVTGWKQ